MPATAAVDGRVSVALCTYNGAVFLEEQLASMLAQTVLPGEIVVSDDGSTDGTSAIVERFAAESSVPVRVLRNPSPLGVTRNFEGRSARPRGA
ncbi:glycosyltransferase [Plantibacter sp. M259]|uniref:glycosyltransferase n=1 Tax=Plantibacter sp. M259 TaxID=2583822 RepID=UPI003519439B